jgi:hypothetical protein
LELFNAAGRHSGNTAAQLPRSLASAMCACTCDSCPHGSSLQCHHFCMAQQGGSQARHPLRQGRARVQVRRKLLAGLVADHLQVLHAGPRVASPACNPTLTLPVCRKLLHAARARKARLSPVLASVYLLAVCARLLDTKWVAGGAACTQVPGSTGALRSSLCQRMLCVNRVCQKRSTRASDRTAPSRCTGACEQRAGPGRAARLVAPNPGLVGAEQLADARANSAGERPGRVAEGAEGRPARAHRAARQHAPLQALGLGQ